MKNIKSVIRKNLKKKDNEHLIYIRYTYNRRYILFRSDAYVLKINWNNDAGRVRKSNLYELKNKILTDKERELEAIVLELISKKIEPTLFNVKIEYYKAKNKYQSDEIKPKKHDEKIFLKDFQEFINDREQKKQVEQDTIKTYKATLTKLTLFQKKKNYFLHYDTINDNFYFAFVNYLRDEEKLLDNSLDKYIKIIKLFMSYSFEKKKHTNVYYLTFKRMKTDTDFVVLNRDELIKLAYKYKPEPGSIKDKVRDTFIFGCSTGLRFGDLIKLTKGNFVIGRDRLKNKIIDDASETYIKLKINKTQDYLKLPINNFIFDLIKKYDIENEEFSFLKHSNQTFNILIKEVCREAGITELVKVSKKRGRENIDYQDPKYTFISSHTMRRTFITSMSNSTEITNVQAVSGHKDLKILMNYIKRNDKELNSVKDNLNDIFYKKDEELIGDKSSGINTRIISKIRK